jgi:hypothetical protein
MLEEKLLLGGALIYVLIGRPGPLQDIVAWLFLLLVALAFVALETLAVLAPLLPKLVPAAFIRGVVGLLTGGHP